MRPLLRTFLDLVLLCAGVLAGVSTHAQSDLMPATRLVVRDARTPVRLERVDIRAELVGRAAQTRVELLIRNPNDRVLEGELQFPLAEGQVVSGFALDIDGALRPAVPVEKAKGQQVFEDVIRARVDPALLEVTQGRNYKLRVYPLPPHGTRRVVLQLAQTLSAASRSEPGIARLELPLRFADSIDRLDVDVRVADAAPASLRIATRGLADEAVQRSQGPGFAQVSLHRAPSRGDAAVSIGVPLRDQAFVAVQSVGDASYFVADLAMAQPDQPRPAPRSITLLWDASGSGAQRDHARELALLDAYFAALRQVDVLLVVGRDSIEPARRFSVRDGQWPALRQALTSVAYDGASNLGALVAASRGDLALLFSDGLANWGPAVDGDAVAMPLYALSASGRMDVARLRGLSERSGGAWIDLQRTPATDAVRMLQTRRATLIGLHGEGLASLVSEGSAAQGGRLAVAGVLKAPQATLTLDWRTPDGSIVQRRVVIAPQGADLQPVADELSGSWVAQRWASWRVAELEADFEQHRAEIRRLGKAFGLVTRETSLIVLDAVADYARHEIEPPAALRGEYARLVTWQRQQAQASRSAHLDQVAARFAQRVAWWERSFPKDGAARQDEVSMVQESRRAPEMALAERQQGAAAKAMPMPPQMPVPAPAMTRPAGVARDLAAADAAPAQGRLRKEALATDNAADAVTTIRLTPWASDSAVARRLRDAPPEKVYARYLDERPDFVDSTAFFLDAADILADKGQPALALRVLSNLAEMDLENRHILRVLGYRLLQAKQPQLAIPVFREVLRLSPDEPQSHRDLGLALAEAGQWQEATERLWDVVARPWNGRFPDIDMTALAELNAIVERAQRMGTPVRTQAFDARLLRNLPLDLRIVMGWDADNTDIDLWVVDPDGEKAYYGHALTRQGGRMSQDATGGYGPEEFALRIAKPGIYTVQAQFYGHRQQVLSTTTTVMLRLTTGFGTEQQKDERVTVRLTGQKDMVTVGRFEVRR